MATTTNSNTNVLNADALLALIKSRRTFYPLNKELSITPARVQEIVREALQHVPSSFNSQSNRVVALFGAEHDRFWDMTTEVLKAIVPAENWESTAGRMAMFRGAAGTVLFFEDQTVVEEMQAKFALYADRCVVSLIFSSCFVPFAPLPFPVLFTAEVSPISVALSPLFHPKGYPHQKTKAADNTQKNRFPVWAGHSSAMLQFAVWTALEAEGLGANLQHYNPIVDAKVAEAWKLPTTWKLSAQLVFGGKTTPDAGEKTFKPVEEKFKVFGA